MNKFTAFYSFHNTLSVLASSTKKCFIIPRFKNCLTVLMDTPCYWSFHQSLSCLYVNHSHMFIMSFANFPHFSQRPMSSWSDWIKDYHYVIYLYVLLFLKPLFSCMQGRKPFSYPSFPKMANQFLYTSPPLHSRWSAVYSTQP